MGLFLVGVFGVGRWAGEDEENEIILTNRREGMKEG